MRKALVLFTLVATLFTAGCSKDEKGDVAILYDVERSDYEGTYEEYMLYMSQVEEVKGAFADAFNKTGIEALGISTWVLRSQSGNGNAIEFAKKIAAEANSSLSSLKPVVGIKITILVSSCFGDEEVVSYEYK